MSESKSENSTGDLAGVFRNADTHRLVSGIIQSQLTNNKDVREEAFKGLDLSGFTTALDVGCGFGFFTGGLTGRLSKGAVITGIDLCEKYRKPYLETAKKAGLRGRFSAEGISLIDTFSERSFDLVICSYALYFFPEYIPRISRILSDEGIFVIITHSCPHMKELTFLVKEMMASENIPPDDLLPYEMLINRFCDYNGTDLLGPYFKNVSRREFRSEILFNRSDFSKFSEYFRFKTPFFIPSGKCDEEKLAGKILKKVGQMLEKNGSFQITKDDTIFVCSCPVKIPAE